MENCIYRFRRLEQLLSSTEGYEGGFDELRKQTIYFAPPQDANDPMEGFKDVFWDGDEVIWKNLLRHYLMCLNRIFELFSLSGENDPIKIEDIPVEISSQDFPTQKYKERYTRISQKFFSNFNVAKYPKSLANRKNPIRRNELFMHLQMLHVYAVKCIYEEFVTSGLMKPWTEKDIFANAQNLLEKVNLCDVLNQTEQRFPRVTNQVEKFMEANSFIAQQLVMITQYNDTQKQFFSPNKWFLLYSFPEKYINRLEELIYSPWYMASFTDCYKNSSMWGHYAGNHQGICLKFKVGNKDSASINFFREKSKADINTALLLHKIQYKSKYHSIDFFRSLGKLSVQRIKSTWYFDENGARSSCYEDVFTKEGNWRKKYWDDFYRIVTTKSKDWEYELEQRLIIPPMHLSATSIEDRCTKYDFSNLEGVIFGIKTPQDKKLAVMQIIEEKCHTSARRDFSFYQAYYCSETGKIEAHKMDLLQFSSPI